jgi:hypothetical protein
MKDWYIGDLDLDSPMVAVKDYKTEVPVEEGAWLPWQAIILTTLSFVFLLLAYLTYE